MIEFNLNESYIEVIYRYEMKNKVFLCAARYCDSVSDVTINGRSVADPAAGKGGGRET